MRGGVYHHKPAPRQSWQAGGAQIVLRNKTPDLVRQEFYGLLLSHFAIRGLMHEAALRVGEYPHRLSFVHAVRVVRRKMPLYGAIPPTGEGSVP